MLTELSVQEGIFIIDGEKAERMVRNRLSPDGQILFLSLSDLPVPSKPQGSGKPS